MCSFVELAFIHSLKTVVLKVEIVFLRVEIGSGKLADSAVANFLEKEREHRSMLH